MKIINYGKQYIDKDDIRYVEKALRSEKITQGKFVNNFEKNLSKYMGSKYCASVSNGSLALFLSLKVLKLKKRCGYHYPNYFCIDCNFDFDE